MQTTDRGITTADIMKAAGTPGALGTSAHSVPTILATLYKAGVSAREVSDVIGQEPGLTASVLRMANSPLYGQSRSVSTIDRAVLLLGLDTVRGIAAAASMRDAILRGTPSSPFDSQAMLRHSVAAALAARALAQLRHPALAAEAFVAGLLHDLGVAVQARLCPDGVTRVVQALRVDPTRDLASLERECIGVDHARCAAVVFEAWKLPASLVAAAGHHHDPAAAPEPHRALAALVNLGHGLGITADSGFPCEPAPGPRCAEATTLLRLSDDDFDGIVAALPEQVEELQRALAGH